MKHVNTVIIGGGTAGLSMGRCLVEHSVDHVILERGQIAERWRSERWHSLRMLTPNWQSRLPHWQYTGTDPDGFMTMSEFIDHLEAYAESYDAPVETGTTVTDVQKRSDGRFVVTTNRGIWMATNLVVATEFSICHVFRNLLRMCRRISLKLSRPNIAIQRKSPKEAS
ncbi:NAD(P)-binding domain-containing protein [Ruegeria arenilitoris]|uniref:NAD(P)-binding domain-containing protein n=1 Tax=Ruegeria arenilitoris TaxID=1173585 RepID=UPI001C2BFB91